MNSITDSEKLDLLLNEMGLMKSEMGLMKSEMTSMKDETSSIKSEVTSIKSEVTSIKSEMTSMKSDMTSMKSDMTSMKSDMTSMGNKLTDIQLTLENETNKNIKIIAEGHLDLTRKLDNALKVELEKEMMLIRITTLENEVRRLKDKIEHSA